MSGAGPGNTGLYLPKPGCPEYLSEVTRTNGALLIFDWVMTGFRFAPGGRRKDGQRGDESVARVVTSCYDGRLTGSEPRHHGAAKLKNKPRQRIMKANKTMLIAALAVGSLLVWSPALRAGDTNTPPSTPPAGTPPAGRPPGGGFERMAEQLNLTADQKTKVQSIEDTRKAENARFATKTPACRRKTGKPNARLSRKKWPSR